MLLASAMETSQECSASGAVARGSGEIGEGRVQQLGELPQVETSRAHRGARAGGTAGVAQGARQAIPGEAGVECAAPMAC